MSLALLLDTSDIPGDTKKKPGGVGTGQISPTERFWKEFNNEISVNNDEPFFVMVRNHYILVVKSECIGHIIISMKK